MDNFSLFSLINFFFILTLSTLGYYRAPSPKADLSKHNSVSSEFAIDDNYIPILDVDPPKESLIIERASKSVQVTPSPQYMKGDSMPNDPPQ